MLILGAISLSVELQINWTNGAISCFMAISSQIILGNYLFILFSLKEYFVQSRTEQLFNNNLSSLLEILHYLDK